MDSALVAHDIYIFDYFQPVLSEAAGEVEAWRFVNERRRHEHYISGLSTCFCIVESTAERLPVLAKMPRR